MTPFKFINKMREKLSPPSFLKTKVEVKLLRTDWIFRGKVE